MNVQQVRILDVIVIAPFLIIASLSGSIPNWIRVGLLIVGIGTLIYNGVNYLKEEDDI